MFVGQVRFEVSTPLDAATEMVARAKGAHAAEAIRLANAYCVALAERDSSYRDLMARGLAYPDGAPIAWVMRWKGALGARRVRGPSFFEDVMRLGVSNGVRHFFLGAHPRTLSALCEEAKRRFPGLEIAGTYAPPFSDIDDTFIADCIERIVPTAPDIVWIGLGTPKQDFVSSAIHEHLDVNTVGVGAAFDFLAGTAHQAPPWIQRSGFEWLFRLVTEPRRLWRRYLVGNAQFVIAVLRNWRKTE